MWYADEQGVYHSSNHDLVVRWIHVSFVVAGHEQLDPNLRKTIAIAGESEGVQHTFDAFEDEDGFDQLVNNLADFLPGLAEDWFATAIAQSSAGQNVTAYESEEYQALPERSSDIGVLMLRSGELDEDVLDEDDELYDWFDETWEKLESNWFEAAQQLPLHEQLFCRLYWVHLEVGNGGLSQFYFNSASDEAELAVDDFRRIGRDDIADRLQTANRLVGDPFPSITEDRRRLFDKLGDDDQLFDRLDEMETSILNGWLEDLKRWFEAQAATATSH